MTKKEREQLREAKGELKKMDRVADRYAEIALGLNNKKHNEIGYSQKSMKKKAAEQKHGDLDDDKDKDGKPRVQKFKARKLVTKDWERVWCEFCQHPNPKDLMFCQLCDSNLVRFKD